MARFPLLAATALALLGIVGTAAAQRSPDRSSELLDALARRLKICAEITENAQRLACYDRIDSDVGSGAAAAPPPAPAAPPPVAAPRPVAPPPGAGPVTAQPLPPPPGAGVPQPGDPRPLAPPPAASAEPQVFRDPATGRVYNPDNVGQPADKPVPPEDRAFDPRAQGRTTIGAPPGSGPARPRTIEARTRPIGTVPQVSGPNSSVPLVALEIPSLRIGAQGRWVLQMNLANNSSQPFDAAVACSFRNGERSVDDVLVWLRGVRGGEKVTTEVSGPAAQIFVDNAPCTVRTPR